MKAGDKVRCIKEGEWNIVYEANEMVKNQPQLTPVFGQMLTVRFVDEMDDGTPVVLFDEMPELADGSGNWFTQRRFEVVE